jgi:energy-coupling factor transporter ATP-binding protein EcfA2
VKIHKLWAENVRGISSRVTMELSPTGLNLVNAPNEMGKTTMAQVLDFLFQHKSSANSQEIKDLKPYGKDVGPLMGAVIEVDGQTYKIEKQWLKDKKTEVELLAPEKKALSGNAADKLIDEIFTEYLDETIWKMIQVAQANFGDLLDNEYDDDRRTALSDYLAQAVADAEGFDDSNVVEKVEAQYLDWWTPKGRPATAAGTSGLLIVEKAEALAELKSKVSDLKDKIADAASVEVEIIVKKESQDVLQKRKQAQDANKDLVTAQRELNTRTAAQGKIDELLASNPAIKDFSQELFDAINDDRGLHMQYIALSSIKLTGLGNVSLEINGNLTSIAKGESRDQKLESPLNITIPNLLSIDYESGATSAAGLEESSKRYTENLKKLGCETFQAAQELSRQHNEYRTLTQNLNALLGVLSIETLQAVIDRNESVKASLPNWETDIIQAPVTASDLEEVAKQVGNKEGRSEEISHNGWHTTLEETIEKISDHEKRLAVLNRKAQAARMLYTVLEEHKSSAEKDYSIHFAKFINNLAKSFYGTDVHFEVSDSFEILSRRMGATEVDVADLSTGAKEQLAILIRLALTQIVQVGEPFPVILDDEFAHSDPDRIAMMNNIFSDFGDDQQFIMLTCTPEKFSGYKPVKTIDLAALRGA